MTRAPRGAYWVAPRLWPAGGVCLVLGSGPSLARADVIRARRSVDGTIAVNDTYLYAPDAECLYAADPKWWKWHAGAIAPHTIGRVVYPAFTGQYRVSLSAHGRPHPPGVDVIERGPETGLSLDPARVALGRNGVYQAINLAVHFGATRILLLGVDMQGGPGAHFFGRHPDGSGPPILTCLERFATLRAPLRAAGVEIVNCTRQTALTCFPQLPLEAALELPRRLPALT